MCDQIIIGKIFKVFTGENNFRGEVWPHTISVNGWNDDRHSLGCGIVMNRNGQSFHNAASF